MSIYLSFKQSEHIKLILPKLEKFPAIIFHFHSTREVHLIFYMSDLQFIWLRMIRLDDVFLKMFNSVLWNLDNSFEYSNSLFTLTENKKLTQKSRGFYAHSPKLYWTLGAPIKMKLQICLLINNRIPYSWQSLQKGPGWGPILMCRTHDESAFHVFIQSHWVPYLWILCKKAVKVWIAFVNQENPLSLW